MAALAAAFVVATVALVGCTAPSPAAETSPTQHPITQEESERLAIARFSVYDRQWVDIDARVPVDGDTLALRGRADMRAHAATAVVETGDGRWALLQWTPEGKAIVELPAEPDGLPQPPATGWDAAVLDLGQPLDAALAVILELASDRPENPLLLRQNGARWVGSDEVDGAAVDVFIAPGGDEKVNELVRYWVDETGLLRRLVADTGGAEPLTVTLTPSEAGVIPLVPELAARGE